MAKRALKAEGIVNTITKATNEVAHASLPFVTKDTFSDFGKQLTIAPDEVRNAWIDNYFNLCGLQVILGKRAYESYFKLLYREPTLTENIQLSMVDAIKAKAYDKEATSRILENEPPRVGVQYIQSVLRRQYQVTDIEDLLTAAFVSTNAFLSFTDATMTQMYSSMEDDNVEMIKQMLNKNLAEGNIRLYPIAAPDNEAELKAFMRVVKRIGADWAAERSRDYNLAQFRTFSPNDDHYFLVNTDMDALNQVYNLPWAFDKSYLEMKSEGTVITMGSGALAGGNVYSMLFDRDFFQIRDKVNMPKYTSFFNPATLSQNRFLTVFTVLSIAFFANATAFINPSVIDDSFTATIDVRDGSDHANPGDYKEVYISGITVASGKYADKFGTWAVSNNTSNDTVIDAESGELTIGADEAGTTVSGNKVVTVTWTSHLNSSVTATKNIILNV